MKKLTIRIKSLPQENLDKLEYGGQNNYALDIRPDRFRTDTLPDSTSIRSTLQPVDRKDANIEAEQGETVYGDFDGDGIVEHMKVGGNRHHSGGTPLSVPDAAFVFSDTRKMKIGGEALESFGKPEDTKKKYTPAELAKQYDVNKYKAILDNPNADPVQKRTAELMISNFEQKLGKLAMLQESMKGFPTGIPQVAMPYLMASQNPAMDGEEMEQAEDSGQYRMGGESKLQKFAGGGTGRRYDFMNLDLDPHTTDRNATPNPKTGVKSKDWNGSKYSKSEWESIKSRIGYTGPDDNKAFQSYLLEKFPDIVNKYHADAPGGYGMPNAKKPVDGLLGRRWDAIVDDVMKPVEVAPVQTITQPNQDVRTTPVEQQAPAEQVNPNTAQYSKNPFDTSKYWTQDKINVLAGIQNKSNLKKYMPWMPQVTGTVPDPTFYDPSRELAANSEAMNTEMMYANQFSGAQAASVRNSAAAGQAAENAANIMAKYNGMNVGVADQFAGISADVTNKVAAANADRMTKLYDGRTIANQAYDNSRSQAGDVIRKNLLSGLDNKQKAAWMNTWYPQYGMDPQDGSIDFNNRGHKGVTPGASSASGASYIELFNKLKKENPTTPDEILKKQADLMMGQMDARNTINSDGESKSSYRGAIPPQLQYLSEMFKPRP